MKRREAREYVMSIAFQIDAVHDWDSDPEKYISREDPAGHTEYVENIVNKVVSERDSIDSLINEVSDGWTTGRMAKADLAIIRVAVAEILYQDDVPKAVAINEAVELAKKYGTGDSAGFINAILGKINE